MLGVSICKELWDCPDPDITPQGQKRRSVEGSRLASLIMTPDFRNTTVTKRATLQGTICDVMSY